MLRERSCSVKEAAQWLITVFLFSIYTSSSCSSPVGYRSGRRNDISLGRGCQYLGTTLHEIGHSIGLYHEQSRPDRDNYVRIIWNNIQRSTAVVTQVYLVKTHFLHSPHLHNYVALKESWGQNFISLFLNLFFIILWLLYLGKTFQQVSWSFDHFSRSCGVYFLWGYQHFTTAFPHTFVNFMEKESLAKCYAFSISLCKINKLQSFESDISDVILANEHF